MLGDTKPDHKIIVRYLHIAKPRRRRPMWPKMMREVSFSPRR
jgi:hypothetical protein